ncbi:DUF5805 domain-containing protein [Salinirubellus salinus]|uniref:DUF5805 domain-containing protein n=1 Tax=Salinirubellus salinus TaxID=1364945 RepID=A0A9E7R571_9EURY|nr:DUF5805 domain-containing protein [Salinirubellus salinus]UWM55676.1 DUF5805 domain-containing protein [Salinirubellus salinus]
MSESSGSGGTDDPNERVGVRTYVPAYQRDLWRDQADELGMSLSEFVRTMVQSGRSGFERVESGQATPSKPVEGGSPDATPGGDGLETGVVELLQSEGPLDWDQLVEGLAGDFEERLEDALDSLQSANRVKYSGRAGGYVVDE